MVSKIFDFFWLNINNKIWNEQYDKSKKEYKDKNVVENAWKNVARNLDFIPDGKARLPVFIYFVFIKNDKYLIIHRLLKQYIYYVSIMY